MSSYFDSYFDIIPLKNGMFAYEVYVKDEAGKLRIKQGLMDSLKNKLTEPIFSYIFYEENLSTMTFLDGDKMGIINNKGHIVVPAKYDLIKKFEKGFYIVENDGKCGALDRIGHPVIPCYFKEITFNEEQQWIVCRAENMDIVEVYDYFGNVVLEWSSENDRVIKLMTW